MPGIPPLPASSPRLTAALRLHHWRVAASHAVRLTPPLCLLIYAARRALPHPSLSRLLMTLTWLQRAVLDALPRPIWVLFAPSTPHARFWHGPSPFRCRVLAVCVLRWAFAAHHLVAVALALPLCCLPLQGACFPRYTCPLDALLARLPLPVCLVASAAVLRHLLASAHLPHVCTFIVMSCTAIYMVAATTLLLATRAAGSPGRTHLPPQPPRHCLLSGTRAAPYL